MEREEKTTQEETLSTESVIDLPVRDEQTDQTRGGGLRIRVVELTTAPPPVGY